MSSSPPKPVTPVAGRVAPPARSGNSRPDRLNRWLGRFLSNLKYLVAALIVYVALSLATFAWLALQSSTRAKAGVIAFDVATGSSPLLYESYVRPFSSVLWLWLSAFHVVSWLLVPIVVATTIDATYRLYENRRLRAEKRLRRRIRKFGSRRFGYVGVELEDFTEQTLETIQDLNRDR